MTTPTRQLANVFVVTAGVALLVLSGCAQTSSGPCDPAAETENVGVAKPQAVSGGIDDHDLRDAKAFYHLAVANEKSDDLDQAVANYSEAIKLCPTCVMLYTRRAIVLTKKGEFERAIADCTEAIQRKPGCAELYNNRGVCAMKSGDLDKAIADYTEAILLDPRRREPYYNRACAFEKKGDAVRSKEDYEKAKRYESAAGTRADANDAE